MNESLNLAEQSTLLEMIVNISDMNEDVIAEKEFAGDEKSQIQALRALISSLTRKLSFLKQKSTQTDLCANKLKNAITQLDYQDRSSRNEAEIFLRLEAEIPRLEHEYTMKQFRLQELEQKIAKAKAKNLDLRRQNCERVQTSALKPQTTPSTYAALKKELSEYQKLKSMLP